MSVWASKDVESRVEDIQNRPRPRKGVQLSPEQQHLLNDISLVESQIISVERQLSAEFIPFRREQQLQSAKGYLAGKLAGLKAKL